MNVAANLNSPRPKPSRLWLWFVGAFVLQAAAWTAWLVVAAHNKIQEVPLATAGGLK